VADGSARQRWSEAPVGIADLLVRGGALPEHESALLLERYGLRFAPRLRATTPEEAAEAASSLGFPVVVKVDGPAHKSRAGGVVLGIESAEEALGAARRLGTSVLVAKQVAPGTEAFCGMTRDTQYGPVLAVGVGGTSVESGGRVAVSAAPLDLETATELVAEAGIDLAREEIAGTLVTLGRIALDHPQIAEIDVNPLILAADGVVAVDALVVLEEGNLSR
jgi:succinyl-CoA synthetase beta subunit